MSKTVVLLFNQRHLLPTGKMALELFPGHQMDTLAYAMRYKLPLGLIMDNINYQTGSIGTMINVEDFYSQDRYGLLTIHIHGYECFEISRVAKTENGIILAKINSLPNWPEQYVQEDVSLLSEKLQYMFERYPELSDFHNEPNFESLPWLCQRWLELLPLPISEKQSLMSTNTCTEAAQYLLSLMKDPH